MEARWKRDGSEIEEGRSTTPTTLAHSEQHTSTKTRLQKHDNQRELGFGKAHQKSIKAHLLKAAMVSVVHRASLRVDSVLVEPPLWPQHRQTDNICEQATQDGTFIERQQQPSRRNTATRERRRSPGSSFTAALQHAVTDGFLVQPVANRQCLQRPTLTCP
jgi:hypothetical protein